MCVCVHVLSSQTVELHASTLNRPWAARYENTFYGSQDAHYPLQDHSNPYIPSLQGNQKISTVSDVWRTVEKRNSRGEKTREERETVEELQERGMREEGTTRQA